MAALPESVLIGRSTELATFARLSRRLAAGRGGLAWVWGEAGAGKSALMDALAERATRLGCRVLRGCGDELAERFPLRMMADTLGVTAGSADPEVQQTARLLRGEITVPGAADPVLAAGERMLALIDRWCAGGPLLLITEDLHWADDWSLLLWNPAGRRRPARPRGGRAGRR